MEMGNYMIQEKQENIGTMDAISIIFNGKPEKHKKHSQKKQAIQYDMEECNLGTNHYFGNGKDYVRYQY